MPERAGTLLELRRQVGHLPTLLAWGSRASSSTGSIFTMQFGKPLADKPSWGELSIMVYSGWRITDQQQQLVCTWRDEGDTVLRPSLTLLHHQQVQEATVSDWGDLQLEFANGWNLHVFADLPNNSTEPTDCWFISIGRHHHVAWTTKNTVEVQTAS